MCSSQCGDDHKGGGFLSGLVIAGGDAGNVLTHQQSDGRGVTPSPITDRLIFARLGACRPGGFFNIGI
jgi:hypothetical protein